eukprot:m.132628 g.132628  ORF g.132628 m.132628 type:complete len:406 (+) comp17504_c0_seq7:293-1510(+)
MASGGQDGEGMKDEYGIVDDAGESFVLPEFQVEHGEILKNVTVRYQTFGTLSERKDNAVVVCHALTGNAAVTNWWPSMVGEGCFIDTRKYFVVCANVLGSCYGTCGPTSINPDTGKKYGATFPYVTIRDTVRLHALMLRDGLGIREVFCAIGGSMGGMQVLEWGLVETVALRSGVVLAAGGRHTPWQIGMSELQRQAIYADPKYKGGTYDDSDPPVKGLSVARQIAMVSYRTHHSYFTKFGRDKTEHPDIREKTRGGDVYQVEAYLRHQGNKFIQRNFDAQTYVTLTRLMDSHDIARNRGDYLTIMSKIRVPFLVVGITSDILYPVTEQQELASYLGQGELHLIDSEEGHDGFLLEQARIGPMVERFFTRVGTTKAVAQQQETISALAAQVQTLTAQVQNLKSRL